MSVCDGPLVPPIRWAQRLEYVLITIPVQDATDVKVEVTEEGRQLRCSCGSPDGKRYECALQLYGTISSEESQHVVRPRQIELKLKKKFSGSLEDAAEDELEWPRLVKEKAKQPNISIDWALWKDEDDDARPADDLGDFGLGGGEGDAMDGEYSTMLNQLMQAQGRREVEDAAGLPHGAIPSFGSARGQKPMDTGAPAAAEGGDEDDDMPPLEEDKD